MGNLFLIFYADMTQFIFKLFLTCFVLIFCYYSTLKLIKNIQKNKNFHFENDISVAETVFKYFNIYRYDIIRIITAIFLLTSIPSIWKKQIDVYLTFYSWGDRLISALNKYHPIANDIQEKTSLIIELNPLPYAINIFSEQNTKIDLSQIKGHKQYKLRICNNSKVELINIDLDCLFPFSIIKKEIDANKDIYDLKFEPANEWFEISGQGEIEVIGKLITPFYKFQANKIGIDGFVELIITLNIARDIWRNGPKEFQVYYIAGKYSRILNDKPFSKEIYYPIMIDDEKSLRLNSPSDTLGPMVNFWGFD